MLGVETVRVSTFFCSFLRLPCLAAEQQGGVSRWRRRDCASKHSKAGLFFRENKAMNQELLRIVDNIARDKNIDKESIFVDPVSYTHLTLPTN